MYSSDMLSKVYDFLEQESGITQLSILELTYFARSLSFKTHYVYNKLRDDKCTFSPTTQFPIEKYINFNQLQNDLIQDEDDLFPIGFEYRFYTWFDAIREDLDDAYLSHIISSCLFESFERVTREKLEFILEILTTQQKSLLLDINPSITMHPTLTDNVLLKAGILLRKLRQKIRF